MVEGNVVAPYNVQAGILAIAAIVWLVCALSGLTGYFAFRQRLDLGWAGAFAVLFLARSMDAYAALRTAQLLGELRPGSVGVIEFLGDYHLRVASIEMVAAFLVLMLFRKRHLLVRRATELT